MPGNGQVALRRVAAAAAAELELASHIVEGPAELDGDNAHGTVTHFSMHNPSQPFQSLMKSFSLSAAGSLSDRLKSGPSPIAVKQTSKHQQPAIHFQTRPSR